MDITEEDYKKLCNQPEILLVKCDGGSLEETLNDYIAKADRLITVSNKLINFYKSQYASVLSFDIWKQMTKFINTPEELDDFEHVAINFSLKGGIHYSTPSKGKYYDIDMNSAYMHFMASSNFNFPVTKPNYKMFAQKEFGELKFYPFGLYLVVFENTHDYFSCFKTEVNQWVSHHDLKCAKLLGIQFSIMEGKTNALLYDSKNCVKGSHAFGEYCNFLYDLKKQNEDVKDFTVSIWGAFCQKLVKRYRLKDDETIDVGDQFIEELNESKNITTIKVTPKVGQIFKYPYARLGPFLTSYVRLKMTEILLKQPKESVLMVNTDGWISTIPRNDLSYGKEMGEFKVWHGNCEVFNSMRVKFQCPKCKEYTKKKCPC
jgi:hypothetical protein